jgi:hypothetical protein
MIEIKNPSQIHQLTGCGRPFGNEAWPRIQALPSVLSLGFLGEAAVGSGEVPRPASGALPQGPQWNAPRLLA